MNNYKTLEDICMAKELLSHPACIIGRLARVEPSLNQLGWAHGYYIKIDLT